MALLGTATSGSTNSDSVCRLQKRSDKTAKHILSLEARKTVIFGPLQSGDDFDATIASRILGCTKSLMPQKHII